MKPNKAIGTYLIGAMIQMGIVCGVIAILRTCKINYSHLVSLIFLAVAGLSADFGEVLWQSGLER